MLERQKYPLQLIGLIPNHQWITPAATALIEEADILAASDRRLELFPQTKALRHRLSLPLESWLKELKAFQRKGKKVVVLTSGDPNYFGLAQNS